MGHFLERADLFGRETDRPGTVGRETKCPTRKEIERHAEIFGSRGPETVHTTVELYEDGRYHVNGVKASNLVRHIRICKMAKPYRAIILDGRCIFEGSCPRWLINDTEARIASGLIQKQQHDTAPYR